MQVLLQEIQGTCYRPTSASLAFLYLFLGGSIFFWRRASTEIAKQASEYHLLIQC